MEFNPENKAKGGDKDKISLDGKTSFASRLKEDKKKLALIGGGALAGLAVLGSAFALAVSNGNGGTPAGGNVPNSQPYSTQDKESIIRESVSEKQSVIFRDDTRVYRDDNGKRGEAYINGSGKEVSAGEDFAVHVTLFDKGGISVLVAEGPQAGARVEFFPVDAKGPHITYNKVGKTSLGPDGKTMRFQALPEGKRSANTVVMQARPKVSGSSVTVAYDSGEFGKVVQEDGRNVYAFTLTGSPQKNSVFSVTLFNGDTYAINLTTGRYTIDSLFLFDPNYQDEQARTGKKPSRDDVPLVNGTIAPPAVAPANKPPKP